MFGPGPVSSPLATPLLTDRKGVEFVTLGDSVDVDAMAACMGLSALIKPEGPLPVIYLSFADGHAYSQCIMVWYMIVISMVPAAH